VTFADIYSPANIARSRARAATIRTRVEAGELGAEWLDIAAEVEAYADDRERATI
jgi:ATP-dependent protease HslVU (ClpYQ) peptidase subunit